MTMRRSQIAARAAVAYRVWAAEGRAVAQAARPWTEGTDNEHPSLSGQDGLPSGVAHLGEAAEAALASVDGALIESTPAFHVQEGEGFVEA